MARLVEDTHRTRAPPVAERYAHRGYVTHKNGNVTICPAPRPETKRNQDGFNQSEAGNKCVNPRPTSEPQCVCDLQTIDYKHKLQQQTVDKKDTHHSASERHSFPLSNVSAKTKTQVHSHTERETGQWLPVGGHWFHQLGDPTCFFLFSVSQRVVGPGGVLRKRPEPQNVPRVGSRPPRGTTASGCVPKEMDIKNQKKTKTKKKTRRQEGGAVAAVWIE